MHLSEFAVRDFINVERHLAPGGVTVFDDILPRNALEAARVRRTGAWAGDVYKAVEIIARHRPDLAVVLINTWPTGTAIVVGCDPSSAVLEQAFPSEVGYLEAPDPQSPPRSTCPVPQRSIPRFCSSPRHGRSWWLRASPGHTMIEKAKDILRSIPTYS